MTPHTNRSPNPDRRTSMKHGRTGRMRHRAALIALAGFCVACGDGGTTQVDVGAQSVAGADETMSAVATTGISATPPTEAIVATTTSSGLPAALEIITAPVSTPAPGPTAAPTLSRGSIGGDVVALQAELIARGYQIEMDGQFGPGTEQAVRVEQELLLLESDGLVGPVTRTSLGLGNAGVSSFASTSQFIDAMRGFLSDGASGGLPPDALTALGMWRDSDFAGVTWQQNETREGVGGRLLTNFYLGGEGGVWNTLEVCTTPSNPIKWCGVWSASFH